MFTSRSRRHALHLLLLAAFIHQLNACPCGHADHNLWLQLGASLLRGQDPGYAASDRPSGEQPPLFEHSHVCEGSEFFYVVDPRPSIDPSEVVEGVDVVELPDLASSDLAAAFRRNAAPLASSGMKVRAQLQVFRL